jgi:hypothetical protein
VRSQDRGGPNLARVPSMVGRTRCVVVGSPANAGIIAAHPRDRDFPSVRTDFTCVDINRGKLWK